MWEKGGIKDPSAALTAFKTVKPYLENCGEMLLNDIVEVFVHRGNLLAAKEAARLHNSSLGFYEHSWEQIALAEGKRGDYKEAIRSARGDEDALHEIAELALKTRNIDAVRAAVKVGQRLCIRRNGRECVVCSGLRDRVANLSKKGR